MIWKVGLQTQVGIPSEPSSVTSIDVHGNIGKIKGLEGICHTRLVV
jgi:hypothetical protein